MNKVRELALKALEQAKRDLARDRHLVPIAFAITRNEVLDFALTFDNPEEKQSAYSQLVSLAQERDAEAIVTINDARLSGAGDCLYLTISGPKLPTQSISVAYKSVGGRIIFGQQDETTGDHLRLLQGWAQEHRA